MIYSQKLIVEVIFPNSLTNRGRSTLQLIHFIRTIYLFNAISKANANGGVACHLQVGGCTQECGIIKFPLTQENFGAMLPLTYFLDLWNTLYENLNRPASCSLLNVENWNIKNTIHWLHSIISYTLDYSILLLMNIHYIACIKLSGRRCSNSD